MCETLDFKPDTISLESSPGFYIFQLIELFEEKASTIEAIFSNLLGIFLRQLGDGQKLAASHEDLILFHMLTSLHPKLPVYIRDKYSPKLEPDKRILDYEAEILRDAEEFLHLHSEQTSKNEEEDIDDPQNRDKLIDKLYEENYDVDDPMLFDDDSLL